MEKPDLANSKRLRGGLAALRTKSYVAVKECATKQVDLQTLFGRELGQLYELYCTKSGTSSSLLFGAMMAAFGVTMKNAFFMLDSAIVKGNNYNFLIAMSGGGKRIGRAVFGILEQVMKEDFACLSNATPAALRKTLLGGKSRNPRLLQCSNVAVVGGDASWLLKGMFGTGSKKVDSCRQVFLQLHSGTELNLPDARSSNVDDLYLSAMVSLCPGPFLQLLHDDRLPSCDGIISRAILFCGNDKLPRMKTQGEAWDKLQLQGFDFDQHTHDGLQLCLDNHNLPVEYALTETAQKGFDAWIESKVKKLKDLDDPAGKSAHSYSLAVVKMLMVYCGMWDAVHHKRHSSREASARSHRRRTVTKTDMDNIIEAYQVSEKCLDIYTSVLNGYLPA